jgi:hypothetical protein
MHQHRDLSTVRDGAVITGIAAAVSALAYALIDDLRPARMLVAPGKQVLRSEYGGLYAVGAHFDGAPQARYVRPATEAEMGASQIAADIDGGAGVFGVVKDGDDITYVLPGSDEWDAATIPTFAAGPAYFRVER